MKRSIFIPIIAFAFALTACGSNSKADNNNKDSENTVSTDAAGKSTDNANKPIHLTTAEFKKLVVNYESNPNEWKYLGDKPCIIDFWATWCPPCKAIAPTLDELAKEYAGQIYIYKVDVDKEKELAQAFGIQSIPTLLFVPLAGNPAAEMGAIPKDKFKEKIDGFLLSKK